MKIFGLKVNKRSKVERRIFNYTKYIPERRNGKDRRISKNGAHVHWIKSLVAGFPKRKP